MSVHTPATRARASLAHPDQTLANESAASPADLSLRRLDKTISEWQRSSRSMLAEPGAESRVAFHFFTFALACTYTHSFCISYSRLGFSAHPYVKARRERQEWLPRAVREVNEKRKKRLHPRSGPNDKGEQHFIHFEHNERRTRHRRNSHTR